ncbi:MAG TPA: YcnI family protein [Acidimicrobiia bacterium]|nr:YcnI family protein [Acidimicrobiia bacterium]
MRRLVPLLALGLVLALAAPAGAHVSVNPREAERGGYAKLAFRVPNERDAAGTTKVEVFFPAEHPLASVNVRPTPGWKYTLEKQRLETPVEREGGDQITEYVSKITWDGGKVGVGEFQEFEISGGPMPDADQMVFKAVQTYENGEVVRWIEEAAEDAEEPEHPAPVLKLLAAGGDAGMAGGGDDAVDADQAEEAAAPETEAETEAASSSSDDDTDPLVVAALVVALLALAVGGTAMGRSKHA